MTREEEIIQTARQKEKEIGFSQFVHNAKGVNSAYGIGFLEGAEWADNWANNIRIKKQEEKDRAIRVQEEKEKRNYNV